MCSDKYLTIIFLSDFLSNNILDIVFCLHFVPYSLFFIFSCYFKMEVDITDLGLSCFLL